MLKNPQELLHSNRKDDTQPLSMCTNNNHMLIKVTPEKHEDEKRASWCFIQIKTTRDSSTKTSNSHLGRHCDIVTCGSIQENRDCRRFWQGRVRSYTGRTDWVRITIGGRNQIETCWFGSSLVCISLLVIRHLSQSLSYHLPSKIEIIFVNDTHGGEEI